MGKDALEELWRQCKQKEQLRLDDLTVFHGHATVLEPEMLREVEEKAKELFGAAPVPVKTSEQTQEECESSSSSSSSSS